MDAFLVNASSRDVYGSALEPSEEVTSDSPNGYAASKLGAEALANAHRHTRDVPITSLRLANAYGRMDTNRWVIPLFITHTMAGEELTVYGDGKLLDFVHIDDVCDAVLTAVSRREVVKGRKINLGFGTGTPLSEVAAVVSKAVDACPRWRVDDDRAGDIGQYVSDLLTAKAVLDFEPSVGLEHGLSATTEWYAEHPETLAELRAADR